MLLKCYECNGTFNTLDVTKTDGSKTTRQMHGNRNDVLQWGAPVLCTSLGLVFVYCRCKLLLQS